jgi:methionyl-tRNA formyltransferase
MKILIANSNSIHQQIERRCKQEFDSPIIHSKDELTLQYLQSICPDFIFFLHWSYFIPKEIYENFNCVVFHMTDLPYGRGGSPLQNLIVRGHSETMISALKVNEGIDTGPVYLKRKLSLFGTAEEIFLRSGKLMFEMISEILTKNLQPQEQLGEPVEFKRRTPADSNIGALTDTETVFNFIRMLDAQGYPKAFLETEYFRFEFSRASLKADGITADVKIIKKI